MTIHVTIWKLHQMKIDGSSCISPLYPPNLKIRKPGVPPRERHFRDRPGMAPFAAEWELDAGAEIGPDALNVAIRGDESDRGPARAGKIPGAGEARVAEFQYSRKRTLKNLR